jgi:hypothetical protein
MEAGNDPVRVVVVVVVVVDKVVEDPNQGD